MTGHASQARFPRGPETALARDDREFAVFGGSDENRLHDAVQADRLSEPGEGSGVELFSRLKAARPDLRDVDFPRARLLPLRVFPGKQRRQSAAEGLAFRTHEPITSAASARYASEPFDLMS